MIQFKRDGRIWNNKLCERLKIIYDFEDGGEKRFDELDTGPKEEVNRIILEKASF
jgi:hypothetical protein